MVETRGVSGKSTDTDRLQLARTPRVGPVTYRQLIRRFGTAADALRALPDLVRRGGGASFRPAAREVVERELTAVGQLGGHHVFADESDFPALLGELPDAPAALILKGDCALLGRPAIAMVGARNSSAAACRLARQFAAGLGEQGQIVTSGLARGIDTAAHQGALATGTIAVIACGLDQCFPPENRALQDEIAARHLLITEYPPGTQPLARHFPHRNRIIAGLAAGTVVVEAAPRSGSLLTARLAADAGREVMAVPGSPLDPRAQGCNSLIREGATLVQSIADIMEAVSRIDSRMLREPAPDYSAAPDREPDACEREILLSLLGPVSVPVDELVRQSGLAAPVVQLVLLELELAGRLERHASNRVSLT
jgi:DNA processing protein